VAFLRERQQRKRAIDVAQTRNSDAARSEDEQPSQKMQDDHRSENSDTPPLRLTASPQLHPFVFGLRCLDWRPSFQFHLDAELWSIVTGKSVPDPGLRCFDPPPRSAQTLGRQETHGSHTMRQKGRADRRQRLLIALIASVVMATAVAQVTNIDFQVIHLPRLQRYPDAQYVAIRTPEEWAALWPEKSKDPNAAPIPAIDFKHFILLIAQTGVKPSSGRMSLRPWIPCRHL
jgi:hypothetical protein